MIGTEEKGMKLRKMNPQPHGMDLQTEAEIHDHLTHFYWFCGSIKDNSWPESLLQSL